MKLFTAKMCHVSSDFFWYRSVFVVYCADMHKRVFMYMRVCAYIMMLEVLYVIITSSEFSGPHVNFQAAFLCDFHHEEYLFCNWFFRF